MREIAFDTETTGLDPATGHRVVEIGAVEMKGRLRTGKTFHAYLNPERDMPPDAFRVHGLSAEYLADKPLFADMADKLLEFIGDAQLVIHNAAFDMKFLNFELEQIGREPLPMERATDTVLIARKKFPGAPASLDALCRRFNIDLSGRTRHGALLDAELLADMYLELLGGRQAALLLEQEDLVSSVQDIAKGAAAVARRHFPPSEEELAAHRAFITTLKNPLWESN